jgi:hypothetical protein
MLELLDRWCPVSVPKPRMITGAVVFLGLPCLDNAGGKAILELLRGRRLVPGPGSLQGLSCFGLFGLAKVLQSGGERC